MRNNDYVAAMYICDVKKLIEKLLNTIEGRYEVSFAPTQRKKIKELCEREIDAHVIGAPSSNNIGCKNDLPVIRCRDCGFYPRPELFDEAPNLPCDLDSVCLLNMSDGYYPGDGCTHGRPREEYDAWKRN